MAAAEPGTIASEAAGAARTWRGRAFGLTLSSRVPVPGLAAAGPSDGGREVAWRRVDGRRLRELTAAAASAPLVDIRRDDGRRFMSVTQIPERGYRIDAPGYGTHLVSPDGRSIRSVLPAFRDLRWQRLFFAQPLPLAAALQGLEVFHASAVALDGRVLAFTASSGTGKTSTAAHLVAAGADFVTDDILALERRDGVLLAHPGPGRLSIAHAELRTVAPERRNRLGRRVTRGGKLVLEPPAVSQPLPLGAIFMLARVPGAGPLRIEPLVEGGAKSILGSGFLPYLRLPERLLTHLETCAELSRTVPAFRIAIPESASARQVAAAVHDHAGATG